ncbi:hypothetical protein ACS5PN_13580 [Roseateles sp. NT4]|uniref:hypothetical protein n=1 Tax=Roseateles sp. NT4 TaxID=3453715 RepID=UPI003EEC2B63
MPFMPHRHFAALSLTFALALPALAAKPGEVLPPDALATATPLTASGHQGWRPGRELRFGDYATRDLKSRGQTRTTACPNGCSKTELGVYRSRFEEAFSTSKHQLRYTLVAAAGEEVDVQLTSQLDQQRRDWMVRWFGLPKDFGVEISRQISVIGTVQPTGEEQAGWRFAFFDDERGALLQGWAEDDTGRHLKLTPLQRLADRHGDGAITLNGVALGYAFELDGKVVAAVATMGAGTVWFSPELTAEQRLPMAGLASALLLRKTF